MKIFGKNIEIKQEDIEKYKYYSRIGVRFAFILFIAIFVYLLVSSFVLAFLTRPESEIMVPGVTGKPFMEVYNSIMRKGLKPEIKFYDVYDMDNGIILDQHPEKGSVVREGDKIKLLVSRSKAFIPVPNLTGLQLPFALNKLKNIHVNDRSFSIKTGVISFVPSNKYADNVVIDHSPSAKELISPDRKMNLLVSAGKAQGDMLMPEVTGQSIDLCFDLLLSKGLNIYEDIVLSDNPDKNGTILSQDPYAGKEIKNGDIVKLKVYYCQMKEKQYIGYERVTYTIPDDEKAGVYEAYINDSRTYNIRFHAQMKPGKNMDFVFKRYGDAEVKIIYNKEEIDEISIDADEY